MSMARVSLTRSHACMTLIELLGLDAASENQQKLQQAQEASRHDARKIAALEREVAFLRAPPYYRDAQTQTSPDAERPIDAASRPVSETRRLSRDLTPRTFADTDELEYERIKDELPGVRQYVQKLQDARVALEEKNREQKAQLRQWAEYQKRWVLKYGPLEKPDHVERETMCSITTSRHRKSSKEDKKKDRAAVDLDHSRVAADNNSNPSSPALDRIPSALAPAVNIGEEQGSSASNQHSAPGPGNGSADNDLPGHQDRSGESGEVVVASVRTLKRKRAASTSQDDGALGTASKPVHIKSDPCSSSPPIAIMSRLLDENHDSVDLDEVGSKTKTPKKHQRFIMEQAMLPQPDIEQADGLMPDQYDEDNSGSSFENSNECFFPDEPSSKEKGEELTVKPGREEQERHTIIEKGQRRQSPVMGRGTMVDRVPRQVANITDGDMANEKPQMRNRQVDDFNRRIEEAQRRNVRDKSKPETPKPYDRLPSLRRDFGTETANFGLPTPTTVVRQFEALRGPHSEESTKRGQLIDPSVLRPTDPNNQILPRTSDQLDKEKSHYPPSRRDRGAAQIHTVLEDGEETPVSRRSKKQKRNAAVERGIADLTTAKGQEHSDAHQRLGSLLAKPSPERPSLPSKRLSVPQGANQRNSKTPPSNLESGALLSKPLTSTDLPRYKSAISNTTPSMSKNKRPATYAKKPALPVLATLDLTSSDPPPIIPEDEPLRSRPVQRLRRDDFKINPAANHGFSHAYREVVRKRTERKCLPNCNRPDCCGDTIKKMLAIGGPLIQRQPGLFESSPPEDDDGDVDYDYNILKDYMGDNYGSWTHLSKDEKQAEWTRAQQWNFGKKFGKHKAMERQRTPPGFWNNDIDSTQDLKQQREEGERIAREEVEERWREAMRPGGLWKFADE